MDSEVISITLERPGICCVVVKTFEMTREINADGSYKSQNTPWSHSFSRTFRSTGAQASHRFELRAFNHQNMLNGIVVTKTPTGYELMLEPVFGVDATIAATRLRAELKPGIDPAPNPKS